MTERARRHAPEAPEPDRDAGGPSAQPTPRAPTGPVVVVGLGVMGGSVVKALARRAPEVRIYGIDPDDESASLAVRDGVIRADRLEDCEPDGATVVFAAPLDVTAALVRHTAETWSRAALATDVASLKSPIVEAARRVSGGAVFVGAHPMCGSERSGYAAARSGLYEDADVWLCPVSGDGAPGGGDAPRGDALDRAGDFWRMLGARPRVVAAREHDRTMTWASHMPQLLASALALALDHAGLTPEELGPGGRDMTRLAGSGGEMWLPILEAAAGRDARALRTVEERIARLRHALQDGDMESLGKLLDRGRRWAAARD